jgi:hypothetical protein
MSRRLVFALAVFAAAVYLGGILAGELVPRYNLTVQANGMYSRFDRWTGRVEIATPARPASWMLVGDPFGEVLRSAREKPTSDGR